MHKKDIEKLKYIEYSKCEMDISKSIIKFLRNEIAAQGDRVKHLKNILIIPRLTRKF